MNKFLLAASVLFLAGTVCAAEKNSDVSKEQQRATLYNFSNDLLNAAGKCLPYSEDFTENNPEFQEVGKMFGNADFRIKVDIAGAENKMCYFSIRYEIEGIQTNVYQCAITEAQQRELVAAMQSRSPEVITKTFASYMEVEQEGMPPEKMPMQSTVSGSLFDVTLAQITGTSCDISTIEPTAEEQQQALEKMSLFSPEFMKSWRACQADSTERTLVFVQEKVEIHGQKGDRCSVSFLDFDMEIPMDILPNIHGYEDLKTLLKNRDISHYNHKPEYTYDGLMFELEECRKNKGLHMGVQMSSDNGMVVTRKGISSEYINGRCFIKLQSEQEIDGSVNDYTVICGLAEKEVQKILTPYRELISQYGAKREIMPDGSVSFTDEQKNAETQKADEELMFWLQQSGLCQKPKF